MPALVLASFAACQGVPDPPEAAPAIDAATRRRLFDLLDRFDPLDTTRLPFVVARTGAWCGSMDAPPEPSLSYGFLLRSDGSRATLRLLDLREVTVEASPHGTPWPCSVGFQTLDLRRFTRDFLARTKRLDEVRDDLGYDSLTSMMEVPIRTLILARACARRGMLPEVEELWTKLGDAYRPETPHGTLECELAATLECHLLHAFSDIASTWQQIADLHRRWLEIFGHERWLAPRVVSQLEEVELAVTVERRLSELMRAGNGENDIERLILELQDDTSSPRPWGTAIFHGPSRPTLREPAWQRLVRHGLAAVPALLEALDDSERPTRCVYTGQKMIVGTLDVADLAEDVLLCISGDAVPDGSSPEQWRAWWVDVQRRGLEAVLAERVMTSKEYKKFSAAKRLLEVAPRRVADVQAAIEREDPTWRGWLVEVVASVSEPGVVEFLLEHLPRCTTDYERTKVAHALLKHGRREGIDFLLQAWNESRIEEPEYVVRFLLGSGVVEAVEAVADRLVAEKWNVRDIVLDELSGHPVHAWRQAPAPAVAPVVERVLIDFLGEPERPLDRLRDPCFWWWGSRADLAATALARFWPDRYAFDASAPPADREQQERRLREEVARRLDARPTR